MGILHNSNNSSTQVHVELKSSPRCSSSDCTKEKLSPAAFNSSPKSVLPNSHSKFAKNKNEGFGSGSRRKRDVKEIEARRLEKVERIALEKCRGGRIVASRFMEPKTKPNAVVSTKKVVETLKSKDVNSRVERIALEKCRGGRIVASRFMEPKTKQNAVVSTKKVVETLKSKDVNSRVERIALEKCRGGRIVASRFMEPKTKQNAVVSTKKVVETLKSKDVNSRQGASFQPAKTVSRVGPPLPPRKLLFKEGEKSVSESNKKGGLKEGRVVASRYKNYSEANKRSLPESNNGSEVVRVRKRWEITSPSEVVNAIRTIQHGGNDNESNNGSEVVRVRKRWEITSPSEVVNAIRMIQHGGNDNESNNGSDVFLKDLFVKFWIFVLMRILKYLFVKF